MKFKDKIIQEFGKFIYQDEDGEYAVESDLETFRPCYVYLKKDYLSCKCSNIIKERSFKQCYFLLKKGIYKKISMWEEQQ